MVHPLQPSASLATVTPGALAQERAHAKDALYTNPCRAAGHRFVPAVFETTGGRNTAFKTFIGRWAQRASLANGSPFQANLRQIGWSLSVLLCKCVAHHLARAFPLAPAGGVDLGPVLHLPDLPLLGVSTAGNDPEGINEMAIAEDYDFPIRVSCRPALIPPELDNPAMEIDPAEPELCQRLQQNTAVLPFFSHDPYNQGTASVPAPADALKGERTLVYADPANGIRVFTRSTPPAEGRPPTLVKLAVQESNEFALASRYSSLFGCFSHMSLILYVLCFLRFFCH